MNQSRTIVGFTFSLTFRMNHCRHLQGAVPHLREKLKPAPIKTGALPTRPLPKPHRGAALLPGRPPAVKQLQPGRHAPIMNVQTAPVSDVRFQAMNAHQPSARWNIRAEEHKKIIFQRFPQALRLSVKQRAQAAKLLLSLH